MLKPTDGLFLKGLVVAKELTEKMWEGKHYQQLKLTLTNGRRSFFYVTTDRQGSIPQVETFKRAIVDVERAASDKSGLTVWGAFAHE